MYIKKILKIVIIVFCIIFLFTTMSSAIISADVFHINNCCVQDCQKCLMIHNTIEFSKNINYIIIYVAMLNAIIPLICTIVTIIQSSIQRDTLVSLNVVLIE